MFLDEIGDMPLSLQSKLLRALENKTIQRVGGDKEIKIDLRLICATHQNIEKYVDDGKFRADLYFRINVFPIEIPTLAERKDDIPLLINFILDELKKKLVHFTYVEYHVVNVNYKLAILQLFIQQISTLAHPH